MDLLDRDPVASRWLPDLHLKFGSQRDSVNPLTQPKSRDSQSSGFVYGLGRDIDRMPDSGRTAETDSARPERHGSRA